MKNSSLADYEVELAGPEGSTTMTIGYAPNPDEAVERALSCHKTATSAKVLRVVKEHAPNSTAISLLSETWESEPNAKGRRFLLRDPLGREAAGEFEGGHLRTAWEFLRKAKPSAGWKTVEMLKILRQAIREDRANCRSDEIDWLLDGAPSQDRVRSYLHGARARDFVHHGSHTF